MLTREMFIQLVFLKESCFVSYKAAIKKYKSSHGSSMVEPVDLVTCFGGVMNMLKGLLYERQVGLHFYNNSNPELHHQDPLTATVRVDCH